MTDLKAVNALFLLTEVETLLKDLLVELAKHKACTNVSCTCEGNDSSKALATRARNATSALRSIGRAL